MSSNKKRDMEASDDDNEYDEDYKDKGRLHDALLRKIGMLRQRCVEYKRIIKKLQMDLRLSKSHARQSKREIRINYDWVDKEADFADSRSGQDSAIFSANLIKITPESKMF
jgi:hypothetical protein